MQVFTKPSDLQMYNVRIEALQIENDVVEKVLYMRKK